MSTLFVFLLLAGGTAVAAKQLGKKTVGTKQLKGNAVTKPKIKKNAVTRAKIRNGSVNAAKIADGAVSNGKIADGAVSGAKIDTASTVFSRRVGRLQKSEVVPITAGFPYPLGSVTQHAGEDNQYIGALEIRFDAGCAQPRTAAVLLLIDALNPAIPFPADFAGYAVVEDKGAGAVTRRAEIGPYPGLGAALYRTAPAADTTRRFDLYLTSSSCTAGSGVSLTGVTLDVIGTR
jgi:hypothetical protein